MLPANLELLLVDWRKRGPHETAWVTQGCVHMRIDLESSQPQIKNFIWDDND